MSRHPRDAVVLGYVRTPVGRYGGALAQVRPDDLASHVIRAVLERTDIGDDQVDEVVFGAANQSGEDNRNVGRMAALLAGLPDSVPGVTVNRLCGSGLEAVNDAARRIRDGEAPHRPELSPLAIEAGHAAPDVGAELELADAPSQVA